jgi:predicted nucleic acid-binding protein
VISAPIARGLLDTQIVLDYRAGWPDPVAFFASIRSRGIPEFSQITAMFVFTDCRDQWEIDSAKVFLRLSKIHAIDKRVVDRAQKLLESLTPPSPLTPDDALIAATAILHKLPLYTLDPAKLGIVSGLTVLQPY